MLVQVKHQRCSSCMTFLRMTSTLLSTTGDLNLNIIDYSIDNDKVKKFINATFEYVLLPNIRKSTRATRDSDNTVDRISHIS